MPWFTQSPRALDIVPVGRIAVDFNPTDYNRPLSQSEHFNKYLGGSPANIAVGMARLGRRVGFLAKISDDAFGDFVQGFFEREGIDVSHVTRCTGGEKLGLTFTEILSPTQSSILMYREGAAAGRDGRLRCGLPRLYLEGRRRDRRVHEPGGRAQRHHPGLARGV